MQIRIWWNVGGKIHSIYWNLDNEKKMQTTSRRIQANRNDIRMKFV